MHDHGLKLSMIIFVSVNGLLIKLANKDRYTYNVKTIWPLQLLFQLFLTICRICGLYPAALFKWGVEEHVIKYDLLISLCANVLVATE
jgi:hypothetical protein